MYYGFYVYWRRRRRRKKKTKLSVYWDYSREKISVIVPFWMPVLWAFALLLIYTFVYVCSFKNIHWLTWKMWVSVISVRLVSWLNVHMWQKLYHCNINMIHVILCMMVVLTGFYLFISFLWRWLYFKSTAVSNSFNWKFNFLIWLSWNFVNLMITLSRSGIYHYFLFYFAHV